MRERGGELKITVVPSFKISFALPISPFPPSYYLHSSPLSAIVVSPFPAPKLHRTLFGRAAFRAEKEEEQDKAYFDPRGVKFEEVKDESEL